MGEIFNKSYADYSSKPEAEKAFSNFKHRWYERLVVAEEISALAFRLSYLLKPYFNLEYGGKAWPSQDTLADQLITQRDTPTARETVNKLLNELVEHGHLFKKRGQHSSAYYMVLKDAEEVSRCDELVTSGEANQEGSHTSDVMNSSHLGKVNGDSDVTSFGSRCDELVTESSSNNFERRSTFGAPREKEVAAAAATPLEGHSLTLGPLQGKKKKKARHGATHSHGGAHGNGAGYVTGTDAGFDEMRRNNSARPYADDINEDYRAYCQALQLIDRDTLLANHKAYVKATVEGDGAKYLKSIAAWCDGRGWEKPLPKPKRNSANGSGRHSNNGARRHRSSASSVTGINKLAAQLKEKQLRRGQ